MSTEKRQRKWGKSRQETSTKLRSWSAGQGIRREKKGNAKHHQREMKVRSRPSHTADPRSHPVETLRAAEGTTRREADEGRGQGRGAGSRGRRLDSGPPARLPAPPFHRSTLELYSGGKIKSDRLQTPVH